TSCAPGVGPELDNANQELNKLRDMGGDPEDIAEIEAMIAEAKELLAAGDTMGARKKLEDARIAAIEAQGRVARRDLDPDREIRTGDPLDIGLVDIFFDYDQSRVRADAAPVLRQNAKIIKENADRIKVVIIEGYCDTRGTDEYNLALGDKRAKSVADYLAGIGVDINLVESVSKGETDEWEAGITEAAYQQNRRAHFKAIAKGSDSMM
nr:OmpA family protein [Candidatus Dadabacteria bacterium]